MNGWIEYYKLYPFDDLHRFHRPAALISVSMAGGDIAARLAYLQPEPGADDLNDADLRTIKALGFTPIMRAQNGSG